MTAGGFVAINWGSSRFRAWRVDDAGRVVDAIDTAEGITGLGRDGIARVVASHAHRWKGAGPILAAGMIGSQSGWCDAGYLPCPVAPLMIARSLVQARIADCEVQIVPGLSCIRADGAPDVMRGEETELLGLLQSDPGLETIVLPGTHTKWVRLAEGRVAHFMTALSSELFDTLRTRGLLAPLMGEQSHDGATFLAAAGDAAGDRVSLVTRLFGERARVMTGRGPAQAVPSRVRGLLIGSEIADAREAGYLEGERPLPLVGNPALGALYAQALEAQGRAARLHDAGDAAIAGFHAIHAASAA